MFDTAALRAVLRCAPVVPVLIVDCLEDAVPLGTAWSRAACRRWNGNGEPSANHNWIAVHDVVQMEGFEGR